MTKIPALLLLLGIFSFIKTSAQNYNVSETEALKIAQSMETSVKNNDATVLSNVFDIDLLTNKIKEKSIEAKKSPDAMFAGFRSTFTMKPFGQQIVANLQDGSYELLRTYEKDHKRHILFRAFGKTGLNYHDYTLVKVEKDIKAEDAYIYLTGEEISTTIANLVDASLTGMGDAGELPEELRTLLKLKEYKKNNDNEAIIKLYESLDGNLRKNRAYEVIYITACQKTDTEKYRASLENYAVTFPDEPNTYLLMIDLYFLNKEYNKGLDAINNLDMLVEKDPFLEFFRGNLYLAMEDNVKAKASYDSVFQIYPALSYVIKNVVILHMNDGEKDIAKAALSTYKKTDGFKQEYIDDLYLMYPELKE